ncbi:hypothetical protein AA0472_0924 [Acetobacter estunensis NRIC 0472]|uniref:DUF2905 family protein n=1 Tax=Acetobacter estunensis TaxID=104097 RepID=A0A967EBY4_9PROT|nr:DUF2905 domain-containing protein [Acetobacter estunensis]MBV1836329.1 DUF2905 domain-containing protein [Acetobacter estunensis]NHO52686.1 DUF2905 family protein [Acetobacter estunensis]GBQ22909.1 hypothetical protein AA0472_0924 [Acetobacter estunensis NRIC 0472]
MTRTLVTIGLALVIVGLLWPWLSRLPIGRLPGDILIRRGDVTFYAPLMTGLIASVLLSVILWAVRR